MKRQVTIMISIATVSFLIGTMFNVMAMDSGGNPWDKVWTAISELQARVNALEQGTNTKTWHFVTSFTLSSEETVSSLFFVQGEKWRIKWEPQYAESGLFFWVWDENGYVLDFVNGGNLLQIHHEAKGIHYMPHGEGRFYIEIQYIGTNSINFTIESYH